MTDTAGTMTTKKMRIFSDASLSASALEILKKGTASHELVFPRRVAESVLVRTEPDPALATADIAFGQPDAGSVLNSDRLRWVHLTSAGYTRYDTPEFRAFAESRRLLVTNSSIVYSEACAEHVFAFMLAQARGLPKGLQTRCANGSPRWIELREGSGLLQNQRAVILGFGAIASRLLELLAPFEMKVIAMRRKPRGDEGIPTVTAAQIEGIGPSVLQGFLAEAGWDMGNWKSAEHLLRLATQASSKAAACWANTSGGCAPASSMRCSAAPKATNPDSFSNSNSAITAPGPQPQKRALALGFQLVPATLPSN